MQGCEFSRDDGRNFTTTAAFVSNRAVSPIATCLVAAHPSALHVWPPICGQDKDRSACQMFASSRQCRREVHVVICVAMPLPRVERAKETTGCLPRRVLEVLLTRPRSPMWSTVCSFGPCFHAKIEDSCRPVSFSKQFLSGFLEPSIGLVI